MHPNTEITSHALLRAWERYGIDAKLDPTLIAMLLEKARANQLGVVSYGANGILFEAIVGILPNTRRIQFVTDHQRQTIITFLPIAPKGGYQKAKIHVHNRKMRD